MCRLGGFTQQTKVHRPSHLAHAHHRSDVGSWPEPEAREVSFPQHGGKHLRALSCFTGDGSPQDRRTTWDRYVDLRVSSADASDVIASTPCVRLSAR